ncbi:MAG: hypothetical protein H0X29_04585 [Parachlamydiaceae bacterium]|nr:hypothetical protein [Parachlamydiaceae bacterium]
MTPGFIETRFLTKNFKSEGRNAVVNVFKNIFATASAKWNKIGHRWKTGEWYNNKTICKLVENQVEKLNKSISESTNLVTGELLGASFVVSELASICLLLKKANAPQDEFGKINGQVIALKKTIESRLMAIKKKDKDQLEELTKDVEWGPPVPKSHQVMQENSVAPTVQGQPQLPPKKQKPQFTTRTARSPDLEKAHVELDKENRDLEIQERKLRSDTSIKTEQSSLEDVKNLRNQESVNVNEMSLSKKAKPEEILSPSVEYDWQKHVMQTLPTSMSSASQNIPKSLESRPEMRSEERSAEIAKQKPIIVPSKEVTSAAVIRELANLIPDGDRSQPITPTNTQASTLSQPKTYPLVGTGPQALRELFKGKISLKEVVSLPPAQKEIMFSNFLLVLLKKDQEGGIADFELSLKIVRKFFKTLNPSKEGVVVSSRNQSPRLLLTDLSGKPIVIKSKQLGKIMLDPEAFIEPLVRANEKQLKSLLNIVTETLQEGLIRREERIEFVEENSPFSAMQIDQNADISIEDNVILSEAEGEKSMQASTEFEVPKKDLGNVSVSQSKSPFIGNIRDKRKELKSDYKKIILQAQGDLRSCLLVLRDSKTNDIKEKLEKFEKSMKELKEFEISLSSKDSKDSNLQNKDVSKILASQFKKAQNKLTQTMPQNMKPITSDRHAEDEQMLQQAISEKKPVSTNESFPVSKKTLNKSKKSSSAGVKAFNEVILKTFGKKDPLKGFINLNISERKNFLYKLLDLTSEFNEEKDISQNPFVNILRAEVSKLSSPQGALVSTLRNSPSVISDAVNTFASASKEELEVLWNNVLTNRPVEQVFDDLVEAGAVRNSSPTIKIEEVIGEQELEDYENLETLFKNRVNSCVNILNESIEDLKHQRTDQITHRKEEFNSAFEALNETREELNKSITKEQTDEIAHLEKEFSRIVMQSDLQNESLQIVREIAVRPDWTHTSEQIQSARMHSIDLLESVAADIKTVFRDEEIGKQLISVIDKFIKAEKKSMMKEEVTEIKTALISAISDLENSNRGQLAEELFNKLKTINNVMGDIELNEIYSQMSKKIDEIEALKSDIIKSNAKFKKEINISPKSFQELSDLLGSATEKLSKISISDFQREDVKKYDAELAELKELLFTEAKKLFNNCQTSCENILKMFNTDLKLNITDADIAARKEQFSSAFENLLQTQGQLTKSFKIELSTEEQLRNQQMITLYNEYNNKAFEKSLNASLNEAASIITDFRTVSVEELGKNPTSVLQKAITDTKNILSNAEQLIEKFKEEGFKPEKKYIERIEGMRLKLAKLDNIYQQKVAAESFKEVLRILVSDVNVNAPKEDELNVMLEKVNILLTKEWSGETKGKFVRLSEEIINNVETRYKEKIKFQDQRVSAKDWDLLKYNKLSQIKKVLVSLSLWGKGEGKERTDLRNLAKEAISQKIPAGEQSIKAEESLLKATSEEQNVVNHPVSSSTLDTEVKRASISDSLSASSLNVASKDQERAVEAAKNRLEVLQAEPPLSSDIDIGWHKLVKKEDKREMANLSEIENLNTEIEKHKILKSKNMKMSQKKVDRNKAKRENTALRKEIAAMKKGVVIRQQRKEAVIQQKIQEHIDKEEALIPLSEEFLEDQGQLGEIRADPFKNVKRQKIHKKHDKARGLDRGLKADTQRPEREGLAPEINPSDRIESPDKSKVLEAKSTVNVKSRDDIETIKERFHIIHQANGIYLKQLLEIKESIEGILSRMAIKESTQDVSSGYAIVDSQFVSNLIATIENVRRMEDGGVLLEDAKKIRTKLEGAITGIKNHSDGKTVGPLLRRLIEIEDNMKSVEKRGNELVENNETVIIVNLFRADSIIKKFNTNSTEELGKHSLEELGEAISETRKILSFLKPAITIYEQEGYSLDQEEYLLENKYDREVEDIEVNLFKIDRIYLQKVAVESFKEDLRTLVSDINANAPEEDILNQMIKQANELLKKEWSSETKDEFVRVSEEIISNIEKRYKEKIKLQDQRVSAKEGDFLIYNKLSQIKKDLASLSLWGKAGGKESADLRKPAKEAISQKKIIPSGEKGNIVETALKKAISEEQRDVEYPVPSSTLDTEVKSGSVSDSLLESSLSVAPKDQERAVEIAKDRLKELQAKIKAEPSLSSDIDILYDENQSKIKDILKEWKDLENDIKNFNDSSLTTLYEQTTNLLSVAEKNAVVGRQREKSGHSGQKQHAEVRESQTRPHSSETTSLKPERSGGVVKEANEAAVQSDLKAPSKLRKYAASLPPIDEEDEEIEKGNLNPDEIISSQATSAAPLSASELVEESQAQVIKPKIEPKVGEIVLNEILKHPSLSHTGLEIQQARFSIWEELSSMNDEFIKLELTPRWVGSFGFEKDVQDVYAKNIKLLNKALKETLKGPNETITAVNTEPMIKALKVVVNTLIDPLSSERFPDVHNLPVDTMLSKLQGFVSQMNLINENRVFSIDKYKNIIEKQLDKTNKALKEFKKYIADLKKSKETNNMQYTENYNKAVLKHSDAIKALETAKKQIQKSKDGLYEKELPLEDYELNYNKLSESVKTSFTEFNKLSKGIVDIKSENVNDLIGKLKTLLAYADQPNSEQLIFELSQIKLSSPFIVKDLKLIFEKADDILKIIEKDVIFSVKGADKDITDVYDETIKLYTSLEGSFEIIELENELLAGRKTLDEIIEDTQRPHSEENIQRARFFVWHALSELIKEDLKVPLYLSESLFKLKAALNKVQGQEDLAITAEASSEMMKRLNKTLESLDYSVENDRPSELKSKVIVFHHKLTDLKEKMDKLNAHSEDSKKYLLDPLNKEIKKMRTPVVDEQMELEIEPMVSLVPMSEDEKFISALLKSIEPQISEMRRSNVPNQEILVHLNEILNQAETRLKQVDSTLSKDLDHYRKDIKTAKEVVEKMIRNSKGNPDL